MVLAGCMKFSTRHSLCLWSTHHYRWERLLLFFSSHNDSNSSYELLATNLLKTAIDCHQPVPIILNWLTLTALSQPFDWWQPLMHLLHYSTTINHDLNTTQQLSTAIQPPVDHYLTTVSPLFDPYISHSWPHPFPRRSACSTQDDAREVFSPPPSPKRCPGHNGQNGGV